jgi:hypothetical protein
MSALTRLVAMILVPAAVLASASPAVTQPSKPPRDPAMIQRKLQRSAELQRQTLQALGDRERAEKLVASAWNELRSAIDDMTINKNNMKFPDPLFPANIKRVEQAFELVLVAWDALKARDKWTGDEGQVQGVRTKLEQALRLTNTAAATTF